MGRTECRFRSVVGLRGLTSAMDSPSDTGPNPFAAVGQGLIVWTKIFAHARQAGVEHIFTEQDLCDGSPFDAIKSSF